MAEKEHNRLIGYDPLSWIEDDTECEKNSIGQVEANAVRDSITNPGIVKKQTPKSGSGVSVSSGSEEVLLDSVLTIQNIVELYQQLLSRLENQDKVELDASEVTSVDTAVLQLIIVLKKTAVDGGKDVIIDFPSEKFIEAAGLLGLSQMLGVERAASGLF